MEFFDELSHEFDYRTFNLTLISAKGLKKGVTLFGKSDVYAVAYVYGSDGTQKSRTPVHKSGGSNPTWNFPMRFTVNYADILEKRVGIVVEIKAVGMFSDKKLGEVRDIKVLKDVPAKGTGQKVSSYQVRTPSGKPKGYITFSYRFGGEFSGYRKQPVAYPPWMAVGSSFSYKPGKGPRDDFLAGVMFGFLMADAANGGGGCGGGECGGGGRKMAETGGCGFS